jgi:hypothetical protein
MSEVEMLDPKLQQTTDNQPRFLNFLFSEWKISILYRKISKRYGKIYKQCFQIK